MNEKFNANAKVEKFTTMLGIAVRLIVKDPLYIMYIVQCKHAGHTHRVLRKCKVDFDKCDSSKCKI